MIQFIVNNVDWSAWFWRLATLSHKYSLLMQRIKIKNPTTFFLLNEQNVFVDGFIIFQSVLLWW